MTDHEIVLGAWKSGFRDIATWAVAIEDAYTWVNAPEILIYC